MTVHGFLSGLLVMALAVSGCGGPVPPDRPAGVAETPDALAPELDLPNARRPAAGILTGGQPSAGALAAARDAGYRAVVNLRTAAEGAEAERATVEQLGLTYVSIPIAGAEGLTEENARALARALETSEGPVLVHCKSGNRVGALLAMKAFYVDGLSPEAALELGLEAGLSRLEGAVRERLGLSGPGS